MERQITASKPSPNSISECFSIHTLLIILLVCHAKALSTQDGVHCTFTLGNYIYQKSYHNSPDLTSALCEPCV